MANAISSILIGAIGAVGVATVAVAVPVASIWAINQLFTETAPISYGWQELVAVWILFIIANVVLTPSVTIKPTQKVEEEEDV